MIYNKQKAVFIDDKKTAVPWDNYLIKNGVIYKNINEFLDQLKKHNSFDFIKKIKWQGF